jgi:imidazolonepropionase-like amidohydrolase
MQDKIGSLKTGSLANFIICSKNLFDKETTIHENWIQGKRYLLQEAPTADLRGKYDLDIDNQKYTLWISGKVDMPQYQISFPNDTNKVQTKFTKQAQLVTLSFTNKDKTTEIRLSGWYENKVMKGVGETAEGKQLKWQAVWKETLPENTKEMPKKEDKKEPVGKVIYPFMAYGNETLPQPETFLITNATIWTNESAGILTETDLLIQNGKIAQVGKNLKTPTNALIIEAKGLHLTAGIIDEHSHIAIEGGVNEGTQSVTAEVRIGDVVDTEDINIYRQLAGGTVAAQLLHGSANSIGGQSALVKLRWGFAPEKMKIENAVGFIKFALGENVKQSNWGDNYRTRFPQTRMGVEQVMFDAFTRAKEYEKLSKMPNANLRRDLELDALVEILNKKRFITCHSYVQSEINMLMKAADSLGFKVNTFTHILEGYKVADKMQKHGAVGSSFADWWAYKFEVKDAIPQNPVLMQKVGVLTCINSDDAEMGRRLNQEAAKSIKYGGMSEEEALKMVTLNPAKALKLDDRMGSIKVGKDADVVLWSDNPLSVYAKVEKTWVDGMLLFDASREAQKLETIQKERSRIIKKMLQAKIGGAATQPVMRQKKRHWHCEDIGNFLEGGDAVK